MGYLIPFENYGNANIILKPTYPFSCKNSGVHRGYEHVIRALGTGVRRMLALRLFGDIRSDPKTSRVRKPKLHIDFF